MPRKKSQNKNSGYKDKLFRIDAELAADLESISNNTTRNRQDVCGEPNQRGEKDEGVGK